MDFTNNKQKTIIKTCPVCDKTFEAKRTTAVYCSENCRVKAHLRKKKTAVYYDNDNETEMEKDTKVDIDLMNVELSGELKVSDVLNILNDISESMKQLDTLRLTLTNKNIELKEDLTVLKIRDSEISQEVNQLKEILKLSEYSLYNGYLNEKYKEAVKNNEPDAASKLVNSIEISLNMRIRMQITSFKDDIVHKINVYDKDLKSIKLKIDALQAEINLNEEQIKGVDHKIRFYQDRTLKYDKLLYRK